MTSTITKTLEPLKTTTRKKAGPRKSVLTNRTMSDSRKFLSELRAKWWSSSSDKPMYPSDFMIQEEGNRLAIQEVALEYFLSVQDSRYQRKKKNKETKLDEVKEKITVKKPIKSTK